MLIPALPFPNHAVPRSSSCNYCGPTGLVPEICKLITSTFENGVRT
jgi:hypothetical protein